MKNIAKKIASLGAGEIAEILISNIFCSKAAANRKDVIAYGIRPETAAPSSGGVRAACKC
jgi:pyrroline-5-carboxylate reductase